MALLSILLMMAAAGTGAEADSGGDGYRLVNPRAIELFEREPPLMRWAIARFDDDHDGYLSIFEADEAAIEFKKIADGDGDGQVTPAEFRAGRDFVVARWAIDTAQATSR